MQTLSLTCPDDWHLHVRDGKSLASVVPDRARRFDPLVTQHLTDNTSPGEIRRAKACGRVYGIKLYPAGATTNAEAFEQAGALARLEAFASFHRPDFYGLPRNTEALTLSKVDWQVPETRAFGEEVVVPFRAGETISWKLAE